MIQAFGDGTCRKHQKIAGKVIWSSAFILKSAATPMIFVFANQTVTSLPRGSSLGKNLCTKTSLIIATGGASALSRSSNAPADYSRISAKMFNPHPATDHDYVWRARSIVIGLQRASELRWCPKSLEELVINVLPRHKLGSLVIGEKHLPPAIRADAFEAPALFPPIEERCRTRRAEIGLVSTVVVLVALPNMNEIFRPAKRQWVEDHRLHHAED
jgi:hypothetical protein